MVNDPVNITFHYLARLRKATSSRALEKDLNVAFVRLPELQAWLGRHDFERATDVSVSYNQTLRAYLIDICLDGSALQLERGGLSRVATMIFGNQFRHESVKWVSLNDIEYSASAGKILGGPYFGTPWVLSSLIQNSMPLFSVPLPVGLSVPEKQQLLKTLIANGVSVFTESPLWNTPASEVAKLATFMEDLCEKHDKRIAYFLNGTCRFPVLQEYLNIISEISIARCTMGIRVCPFSVGLNTCSFIRQYNIPIYGYNLLMVGQLHAPQLEVSPRALATLFRMAGCDLVNIGLKYQTLTKTNTISTFLSACRDKAASMVDPAFPMLTGGITPTVAHGIARDHGTQLGLHFKKPLLRSGLDMRKTKRNLRAYHEALKPAIAGQSLEEAMAHETKKTKNLRGYQQEYGEHA